MESTSRGNLFMFLLILWEVVGSIILMTLLSFLPTALPLTWLNIINQFFTLFLPVVLYLLLSKQKITDALPLKKLSLKNIIFIILMMICCLPIASLLGAITSLFFGNEVTEFIIQMYDQPFAVLVAALCISPAIFEELVLRGVVLHNYKHVNVHMAAIINGLFFGIFHLQAEQFLYAFLLGAIFAYFVFYTQSLWASIIAHFVFNFTQTVLSYASYHYSLNQGITIEEMLATPPINEQIQQILFLAVASAIFTTAFVMLFIQFKQYNRKRLLQETIYQVDFESNPEPLQPISYQSKNKVTNWSFWSILVVYIAFIILNQIVVI